MKKLFLLLISLFLIVGCTIESYSWEEAEKDLNTAGWIYEYRNDENQGINKRIKEILKIEDKIDVFIQEKYIYASKNDEKAFIFCYNPTTSFIVADVIRNAEGEYNYYYSLYGMVLVVSTSLELKDYMTEFTNWQFK